MAIVETPSGNPVLAALLSLLLPGLGQIYSKRVLVGVLWMFAGAVLWLVAMGWIVHLASAFFAYYHAARRF